MNGIKLAKFIETFNKDKNDLFGISFTIADLEKAIKEKKILNNDVKAFIEEDYAQIFDWVEDMKEVVSALRGIVRNPRTSLDTHLEVMKSEKVTNISNRVVNDTLMHSEYWKLDANHETRPERMIAPIYEDSLCIYENRFIVFLINKLDPFIKDALRYLLARVNFMEKKYINGELDFQEYLNLDDISSFEKVIEENKLCLTNGPYLECISTLTHTISVLHYIKSTVFYKVLRKVKPLSEGDIRATNILASRTPYGRCYRFYIKMKKINRDFFEKPGIDFVNDYKDYVFVNLILSLKKLGYAFYNDPIPLVDGHIVTKEEIVGRHKSGAKIYISINGEKISTKIVMKFDGELYIPERLIYRRTSWVDFYFLANTNDEYGIGKLQREGMKIIGDNVGKTCTNAFIVSPFYSDIKNSFVLCSPASFKENSDLENALSSATSFMEVDVKKYKRICPICGKHIVVEDNVANFNCPHCFSTYSYCKRKENWEYVDTVWIKRIGRPGRN